MIQMERGNGGLSHKEGLAQTIIPEFNLMKAVNELDCMVISSDIREKVCLFIRNHDLVKRRFSELGIDHLIAYGRGTTIMIFGPPGTGKTLLANTISKMMSKPLFGLKGEQGIKFDRPGGYSDHAIEELFRLSNERDGMVFIDECDRFMDERSTEYETLLNQLEKHDGVAILATNYPERIGKAFDRRISLKIEMPVPNEEMREQLWKVHIPDCIALDRKADLKVLAQTYALTGGYIKNAVIAALHRVFERDQDQHVLTKEDLEYGARLQSLEVGVDHRFYKAIKLQHGPQSLKLSEVARRKIDALIRIDQNIESDAKDTSDDLLKGLKVMLWGDRPARLTKTAYTVAASLKRNIMQMSIGVLQGEGHRERRKMTDVFFEKAAATNDVIVIVDDCDYISLSPERLPEWLTDMFLEGFRQYRGLAFFAGSQIPNFSLNPLFHMEINLKNTDYAMQKTLIDEWMRNYVGDRSLELDIRLQLLKLNAYQFIQFEENVKVLSLGYDLPGKHIADIIRAALIPLGMIPNKRKSLF